MAISKGPVDGGQGGKLGHSNMTHWDYIARLLAATENAAAPGFERLVAAFRRLARRAIRPAVLRLVGQVNEHFEAASAAFCVAPGKAVETA